MIQRYFKAHNVRTNKSEMVPDNVYGNFILYSDHEAALADAQEELAWSMNRIHDLERIWTASEKYAKHCVIAIKGLEDSIAERCQCRFDDAKQEITTWCAHHAALRDNAEDALAAEVKRREEAEACPVCSGTGEKSTDGRPCACNGSGKWYETYKYKRIDEYYVAKRSFRLEGELSVVKKLYKESCKASYDYSELEAERDEWKATASHEADGLESWKKEGEKLTAENKRLREALEDWLTILWGRNGL